MQRPTSTPSKVLAWQAPQNRRQLRHQTNAAIDILSLAKTGASAIDLIRKLSQQTKATFARAEFAEIETAYAGKQARAGPGERGELAGGTVAGWGFFRKNRDGGARKGGSCSCKSQSKAERMHANLKEGREEVCGR